MVASTAECFRAVFAHMDLLADLSRRGLDADWNASGAVAEQDPDSLS